MKRQFLGLITRCKDEFFIKEFCDYYLSQGVNKIYVLDDDSDDKSIYNTINSNKVEIKYNQGWEGENVQLAMDSVNKLYKTIRHKFKWLICVDVDEFITTKKHKNKTIRQELKTTFKNVDCVCVPWVNMSSNGRIKNPKSILLENTYRWNHDLKHKKNRGRYKKFSCCYNKIGIKCIFKTKKFYKMKGAHRPEKDKGINSINSINSVNLKKNTIKRINIDGLREKEIKNGYLVCYHYRIISKENTENKIRNKWYKSFKWKQISKYDYAEVIDETLKNKMQKFLKKSKMDEKERVYNLSTTI